MKILHIEIEQYNREIITRTFIGNEFSPDPMEVQTRIIVNFQDSQIRYDALSREIDVYCKEEKIQFDESDVLAILTKAGYTEYKPVTVRLFIAGETE